MDFIMDNIVAIIFGCITVIVPFLIFVMQKERKQLSYEIISSTSLIVKNAEIGDIKIFYKDEELKEDVSLVLLKIVNNGNVAIEEKDFSDDIEIVTDCEILSIEVKETKPIDLIESVHIDSEMLEIFNTPRIKPLLLNDKDEIILKLIIKSFDNDIKVKSRITGVKEITKLKKEDNLFIRMIKRSPTSMAFLSIAFIVLTGNTVYEKGLTLINILKAMLSTGMGIVLGVGIAALILKLQSKIKNSK